MPYKDPEKRREAGRLASQRWCERHPERARARDRAWKRRNKALIAERQAANQAKRTIDQRRRRKENPAQNRIYLARRRARKLDQFIEDVDPTVVYQMHGGMCGICKEFIDGKFHVDHVIPLSKGGMHGYVNVQPAHPTCNMRKGNRTL